LKEFVTHDTLVAQAGDILLEIENKEVQYMTLVRPAEADALYTALSEFLRNQDSNVYNVPIKKKKHDN
jgi:ABC-type molybdate transport system substrate-binding protein